MHNKWVPKIILKKELKDLQKNKLKKNLEKIVIKNWRKNKKYFK